MNLEKIKTLPAWLLLALSASLLRFKVSLQSDTLFLDDLFTDLLFHGGHWADWKFPSAPAFVPDMLLYLLTLPLFEQPATRIFVVSLVQVFLLAGALLWCARQIAPSLGKAGATSILLLLALFTLASARSGMWLYFYSTNNHFASLLFGLTGTGLMLRFLNRPDRLGGMLLMASSTLALLSTALFQLSFMLPALALLALAWLLLADRQRSYQPQRRALLQLMAMLVAAQVLALMLSRLLIRNPADEGRILPSAEAAGNALRNFILAIKTAFMPDNPLTMACAVLVLLALLALGYRLLRALTLDRTGAVLGVSDWRFSAAAALLCSILAINLPGVILSGGFADPFGLRYLMLPIALALLLGLIQLQRAPVRLLWLPRAAQLALGVVLLGGIRLAWQPPAPITDNSTLAAGCLARIADQGFVLRAGIADYWNGRAVSYLLAGRTPMLVTDQLLAPDFHVATLGPLRRPQNYPAHRYNFAVLYGTVQPVNPQYTAAVMHAALPAPARIESCAGGRLEIWLYQDDSLDRAVRQASAAYLRQRQGGL